jgi:hypothetical protein
MSPGTGCCSLFVSGDDHWRPEAATRWRRGSDAGVVARVPPMRAPHDSGVKPSHDPQIGGKRSPDTYDVESQAVPYTP